MINNNTYVACFYNGNFYSREIREHDTTIYSDVELGEFSSLKKCNEFLNNAENIYIDNNLGDLL